MINFLNLKAINESYQPELSQSIQNIVNSGWYLLGNEVKKFEDNYANFIGAKYCIGVANGLDALRLIFKAYIELGFIQQNDEVIVPANTYIASILAITDNNLTPILIEPSIDSYQIDDNLIERAITNKTKAIMIVHLYGQCAYTKKIGDLCKKYNLLLIEDNAQAHGCEYSTGNFSSKTGSIGNAAGHSFYPGKNLGCLGDGGAITTNNKELASIVRSMANYGSEKKYFFDYKGINSRLDEIQAAVLNVKLKYLNSDNQKRQQVAKFYIENISNPLIILPNIPDWQANVCHIFPIRTTKRNYLQEHLALNGIQTLIHYPIPPHKQKCYKEWNGLSFPITEKIHNEVLSLPISPIMNNEDVKKVVDVVNAFKNTL